MRNGRFSELPVTDNGHGLTTEMMANAFKPFVSSKANGWGSALRSAGRSSRLMAARCNSTPPIYKARGSCSHCRFGDQHDLNKRIAGDLGTVEKTVKVHRSRMMGKMGVRSVADLALMIQRFNP